MIVHSYGDVTGEHLNIRAHVGLQDLSMIGKIDIKGPDAEALVNHMIVNDAASMAPESGALRQRLRARWRHHG